MKLRALQLLRPPLPPRGLATDLPDPPVERTPVARGQRARPSPSRVAVAQVRPHQGRATPMRTM
eukprot:3296678-Pyramimonas_sp.AAC.1